MLILGIESSCDDTAVALVRDGCVVVAEKRASQVALHEQYGGVVPEIAAREHLRSIYPLLQGLLADAQLTPADIDAVAVTATPGMIGGLLVGTNAAETAALLWGKPLLAVHHVAGHLASTALGGAEVRYPYISLTASGGHTALYLVAGPADIQLLGQTLDDSAGETFDKAAAMLGLPYPGGPAIAALAAQARAAGHAPFAGRLPRPLLPKLGADNVDFSFSGLKNAVRLLTEEHPDADELTRAAIALEVEEAITETMAEKLRRAVAQHRPAQVHLVGGVSANQRLRSLLEQMAAEQGWQLLLAPLRYAMDNAAMIAARAYVHPVPYENRLVNAQSEIW